ncbi:MAG: amino acid adenylation domain-containing protein, partial [Planctomycetes bacterium]|nr:amino acid adenylation domain-containing protein [Planctomycetota bacterium]
MDSLELPVEFVEDIRQEGEYEIVLEVMERKNGFILNWKYNPELFDESTIKRMLGHYTKLIEDVITEPDMKLDDYSLISEEEQRILRFDWNNTRSDYPKHQCVHELFEFQALKSPQAVAVVYDDQSLTYEQLNHKSAVLADYLQVQGVAINDLVAICVERSLDMVIGLLGILRAGGAYVPLDPEYPTERLKYCLRDSQAKVILTQAGLKERVLTLAKSPSQPGCSESTISVLVMDEQWPEIKTSETKIKRPQSKAQSCDLAYVIYTSGSTGNPKGVMIPHQALVNFLISMTKQPGFRTEDRLLAVTTYCFDIAGLELFLPLIKGAKCYICDGEKTKNAECLKDVIHHVKPTIMQATPSTWTMLFHAGWKNEEKIKILCGGEVLPESLKQLFVKTDSDAWNLFGPTETTVWSTHDKVTKDKPITIGTPIANTGINILDKRNIITPIGIPGELCISGDGLAWGYLNKPDLTARKFVGNPFNSGSKLYRTGDLARWRSDGTIEYLGRIDSQVKIHGFRVELGEIESQLNQHSEIKENAVIVREQEGSKQLIAYYVLTQKNYKKEGGHTEEFRAYLNTKLPEYMIPAFFVAIDEVPLTPNGKFDRKELMSRKIVLRNDVRCLPPQSEIEKYILNIWKEVLDIDDINPTDGFFEAGGNSLSAVILAERIKTTFQISFTATNLFRYADVQQISRYVSKTISDEVLDDTVRDEPTTACLPSHGVFDRNDSPKCYPDYYKDSLAIIGISCNFPGAASYREYCQNLKDGKESAEFLSMDELLQAHVPEEMIFNPDYVPMQLTIEGKELFDPAFFNLSPKNASLMDPQFRQLLLHSWQAIEDAGYVSKKIPETSVFMSVSNSFYQTLLKNTTMIQVSDDYLTWILAQGGTIPTMISYELGLRGPSVFIHSNCSSSLAALSLAFQSLRLNESEYALVGASTLLPSSMIGYIYQPELNFSSDGRCRAFDASADGLVVGEGAGVVVVKKAVNAIEDGDHIYALVRGVGLNNDGSDKVGYYAPGEHGQSEVIQKVLSSTGVNPESIRYVEAHGTGTKLGDPVEVSALTAVYRKYTSRKQFCALGSVKPNIGHLDTAAGLAGLVKVALSLKNREIYPSINYTKANPEIDFEDSPFYVVDHLKKWPKETGPRRAAVSSFGIGGTNAHAILEEYLAVETAESISVNQVVVREDYLIPFSAKSRDRLYAYAVKFLEFFKGSEGRSLNLRDLSYTLQVGREAMVSRVVFIADSVETLVEELNGFTEKNENKENCFRGEARKWSDDVKSIENDKNSRKLIMKWIANGRLRKLAQLWTKGGHVDWPLLYQGSRPQRISLPTYPFAQDRCGIEMKEVGVDGYQSTPGGNLSQLGRGSRGNLHPLVHENTSEFCEQRFSATFTGDEYFLTDHRVNGERVLPNVAYLEIVQEAIKRASGYVFKDNQNIQIENVVWAQPISVGVHPVQVNIVLIQEESGEIAYEIYTDNPNQEHDSVVHSQGVVKLNSFERVPSLNIPELRKRFNQRCISSQKCYDTFKMIGVDYLASYRGLETVYVAKNEVLAELTLPSSVSDTINQYTLHPCLLVSALQSSIGLTMDSREWLPHSRRPSGKPSLVNASVPFTLKKFEIFGKCTTSMVSWVRICESDTRAEEIQRSKHKDYCNRVMDIDLCNEQGNLVAAMRGMSFQLDEIDSLHYPHTDSCQPAMATSKQPSLLVDRKEIEPEGVSLKPSQVSLLAPLSLAFSTGHHKGIKDVEKPVHPVLKRVDVLDDFKAAMETNGVIPTLNRTGFMLERLNAYSEYFADYAGQCEGEVLDIGCAYGVATIAALERGGRVLAVDMEQRHLDILQDRIRDVVKKRIRTQQGLLPGINFEDEFFAAIHAGRVIHFLSPDDVKVTIQKMYRWLQPGGKLILTTDTPYAGYWASKAPDYESRKKTGDLWPGFIENVSEFFDAQVIEGGPSLINPLDPDVLNRECSAAGLVVEKVGFFESPGIDSGTEKVQQACVGIIASKPGNRKVLEPPLTFSTTVGSVSSFDGVPICYRVDGSGNCALLFVHGLGCDQSYWSKQISYYASQYTVVTIDLAGHGKSGAERTQFTVEAFGQDVIAVANHLKLKKIVLVGHSLGGPVIIEVASLIPDLIIGMVGVDTLHNLEPRPMNPDQIEAYTEAFHATRGTPEDLMNTFDPGLSAYISEKKLTDPPEVINGAFKEMVCYLQTMIKTKKVPAPLVLINFSDWVPTNLEVARRYGVEVKLINGKGHFPMIEESGTFNRLLDETLSQFIENKLKPEPAEPEPVGATSPLNQ